MPKVRMGLRFGVFFMRSHSKSRVEIATSILELYARRFFDHFGKFQWNYSDAIFRVYDDAQNRDHTPESVN